MRFSKTVNLEIFNLKKVPAQAHFIFSFDFKTCITPNMFSKNKKKTTIFNKNKFSK